MKTLNRIYIEIITIFQPKGGGQCNSLRKQNKLLRQMLLSVTDGDDILDEVPVDEDPFQFDASQIHLSKVVLLWAQQSLSTSKSNTRFNI